MYNLEDYKTSDELHAIKRLILLLNHNTWTCSALDPDRVL